MGTKLLIIDPQNDFCECEPAALPAPGVDLLEACDDRQRSRTVLLSDCMSPVPGFEAAAGATLTTSEQACTALERHRRVR